MNPQNFAGYAYELKPSALESLTSEYPYCIDQPRLKSDSVSHDLELVDIDRKLFALPCMEDIYTENMLLCCSEFEEIKPLAEFRRLRSDRGLVVRLGDRIRYFALEFEQSAKSKARYRSKFKDYYDTRHIAGVLYVCSTGRLKKSLREIDERLRAHSGPPFYFADAKEFFRDERKAIFTSFSGAKIELA